MRSRTPSARCRYLLIYLVSGLAGSAGALIANPNAVTVGASGAIFGILGAAVVLERQQPTCSAEARSP